MRRAIEGATRPPRKVTGAAVESSTSFTLVSIEQNKDHRISATTARTRHHRGPSYRGIDSTPEDFH